MRFMRYRRVQFLAVGSILTVSLSACNETPTFSQAGVLTKVVSPQAPAEDAVAGGTDEESSNDPSANGPSSPPSTPVDDLTAEDKGETPQDGVGVTRWLFNSSAYLTGSLSYSSSSNEVTQSLIMDNNTSASETAFTQLDRPTITDLFAQSSDLRSVSESFQQNSSASGALDLLLVIDNSGSMAEEQVNLSDKLSPLLSFVQNSDWRIGVVTTDPKDGCLRNLISKTDQNAMASFASAVQPGIKGSGNERGIQQAVAGLKGECNTSGSWLRNQSTVGVLIVSD
ncbi:MAG: VWA domain-containing protein, partial [Proteobacteria bacterium]